MISRTVPTGAGWAYEVKHDGFRFICHRDGERVRVFSRGGHDCNEVQRILSPNVVPMPARR